MRAAVAGHPIAHSRSPELHLAAYRALGLDWSYERLDCDAGALPTLLERLRREWPDWAGLSLTMPLKQAAAELVDEAHTDLGAVNTVVVTDGGRLHGYNTDVDGIAVALAELLAAPPSRAAVLGAGGTARAAVAALAGAGAHEIVVVARSPQRAAGLVDIGARRGSEVRVQAWSPPPAGWPVVVTLPVGAGADLPATGAVLDVRYEPWPSAYAAGAAHAGWPVLGGLSVLAGQAERQVALLTGRAPPAGLLRRMLQVTARTDAPTGHPGPAER